jgi:uncharacterized protein (DUF1810 family)
MHAPRFGGKRKDDNRYPRLSDDMKFRSCMTLFDAVSKQEIFAEAIAAFYPDGKDRATLEILETSRCVYRKFHSA